VWGNDESDPICANREPVAQRLATGPRYDAVVIAVTRYADGPTYAVHPADQPDPRIQGYLAAWAPVIARGTKIIVISDNPAVPQPTTPPSRGCRQDRGDRTRRTVMA